ncbi:MAG TPA: PKD domain-containing protein [Vicinamibacterales bacterium]|nr:PKD domain-containing protein [Vicinamibacterales bacterium]
MAMKSLSRLFIVSAGLTAVVAAGCTLESPNAPPLTGPSTLALSLTAAASPDILPEDGVSQSVIRITARDQFGQPLPNVALRVDIVVGSTVVDFGVLSARNVTTNASGEATVIYTAPRAPQQGIDTGSIVTIAVRPVGTNFLGSAAGTSTSIRLVPETTALIPGAPEPSFYFSPTDPAVGVRVYFDATASRDPDGTIVRYRWNYGDGEFEEGPVNHKDYVEPGTFIVTLTVTDNDGKSASQSKPITISGS